MGGLLALVAAAFMPGTAAAQGAGAGPVGSVVGTVFDSTSMEVLSDARVAVMGTTVLGRSDENGQFRVDSVPVGSWWVSFFHPRLQTLGVSPPSRKVTVEEGRATRADLAVPSETTLLRGWCMAEQPGPGYAALAGVVTDSLTGVPMPRATVRAQVVGSSLLRSEPVEVQTDDAGYYRMCAVPAGKELRVQATFGQSAGRTVFLSLPESGAVIQDLMLLMSSEGTLTGRVVDYVSGNPVEGALVSVLGTDSEALTDSVGHFIMDDLPPGRHLVVTEGLGYAQRTDSVTIFSQETVEIEVRMATEAVELEGMVVTARSRFGRTSLAMDAKRADFITRKEIEPLLPRVQHAGDLLRLMNVPGLSIRQITITDVTGVTVPGLCIEVSRRFGGDRCNQAAVYVNDVRMPYPDQILMDLDPNVIERIEVISPIDAQFQFGGSGANGVIAIYTR